MAEVALSLPFSVDPYGGITTTNDQTKILIFSTIVIHKFDHLGVL